MNAFNERLDVPVATIYTWNRKSSGEGVIGRVTAKINHSKLLLRPQKRQECTKALRTVVAFRKSPTFHEAQAAILVVNGLDSHLSVESPPVIPTGRLVRSPKPPPSDPPMVSEVKHRERKIVYLDTLGDCLL
ncbi:unnamed protein product [Mesocestoides corti]|uniref:DNA helicase n=1 Tax=Mesocestoides corti TaxID=53468 RepID=A0A0R3UN15_MESCO|nr:unnamed protein product [Mesocestoides corti]